MPKTPELFIPQRNLLEKLQRWLPSNRKVLISQLPRHSGKTSLLAMLPMWLDDVEIYYASTGMKAAMELKKLCEKHNPGFCTNKLSEASFRGFGPEWPRPDLTLFKSEPNKAYFTNHHDLKWFLGQAAFCQALASTHHMKIFVIDNFWFLDTSTLPRLRLCPFAKTLAVGTPTIPDGKNRFSHDFWRRSLLDEAVDCMFWLMMCLRKLGITLPPSTIDMILKYLAIEKQTPEPMIHMTAYNKSGQEIAFSEFMGMFKKHNDNM